MECAMAKAVARLTPVSVEPTSSPVFPSLHAQGLQDAAYQLTRKALELQNYSLKSEGPQLCGGHC